MGGQDKRIVIVSGIGPGPSGTGRLVTHLSRDCKSHGIQLVTGPSRSTPPRAALREHHLRKFLAGSADRIAGWWHPRAALVSGLLRRADELVVLHPQSIGFDLVRRMVQSRPFTWFYVMDASFFCVRSYNHLPDGTGPCLKCLSGKMSEATANGCIQAFRDGTRMATFIGDVRVAVSNGTVGFLAQNELQVGLLRDSFGPDVPVRQVGVWASDWDRAIDSAVQAATADDSAPVVFHGGGHPAKGSRWAFRVAEHCPDLSFLFPFNRPALLSIPENCDFRAMTWETGLEAAVRAAPVVLVPSLWSAPVEGALIKSIALARSVAVVDTSSAFSHELPAEVVARLDPDPAIAAVELRRLAASRASSFQARIDWLEAFGVANRPLAENIAQCLK